MKKPTTVSIHRSYKSGREVTCEINPEHQTMWDWMEDVVYDDDIFRNVFYTNTMHCYLGDENFALIFVSDYICNPDYGKREVYLFSRHTEAFFKMNQGKFSLQADKMKTMLDHFKIKQSRLSLFQAHFEDLKSSIIEAGEVEPLMSPIFLWLDRLAYPEKTLVKTPTDFDIIC